VIGVICREDQSAVVEEFFELFKTPWETYVRGRQYSVVLTTTDEVPQTNAKLVVSFGAGPKSIDACNGLAVFPQCKQSPIKYQDLWLPIYGDLALVDCAERGTTVVSGAQGNVGVRIPLASGAALIRLGYDLFDEVRCLISNGQPIGHAFVPTLDLHIELLRSWILAEEIAFVEIPPVPAEHRFMVCLTHDIDFVGIRNHKFDHTMWGFLYRSTIGAFRRLLSGRIDFGKFLKTVKAALSLPMVLLGWMKDFWSPFEWYLEVEEGLPTTYFLIPFKGRAGENVPGKNASRRAAKYDVRNLSEWTRTIQKRGSEIGVHGIDAWHSSEKGRLELNRIEEVAGVPTKGIRMHWLLQNAKTHATLEAAGYNYDASAGYNETVGYRNGTTQVFRPPQANKLLELPTHIQDGALFYPARLDLSEAEANDICNRLIDNSKSLGGVLTLIWHDRSHGPERFWGEFYVNLLKTLKDSGAYFGSAGATVEWFRKRREVRFTQSENGDGMRARLGYEGEEIQPPLKVRMHFPALSPPMRGAGEEIPGKVVDLAWNGKCSDSAELKAASQFLEIGPSVKAVPQL